jgi:hypothetical protein
MQRKYSGLNELIKEDSEANSYYNSLPQYVKEMICQQEQNVNSFDSLHSFADNYTKEDD